MTDANATPRASPSPPGSTYRLQFHAGFTFRDATAVVPYLAQLGITHVYASPYLKARPGSTHGYDVIDHCSLNPEIGTEADYTEFLEALARHGMSHILDIVPNHVGVGTNENVWWNDVLENGPASRYAEYFDIAWHGSPRADLHERVLLPLLGDRYAAVLKRGELRLGFANGAFAIGYFERRFPISPRTYRKILEPGLAALKDGLQPDVYRQVEDLIRACERLPDRCDVESGSAERRAIEAASIKQRLDHLAREHDEVRQLIDRSIDKINGTSGHPARFDLLDDLLRCQCYRLAYWKVAPDEINYRRFFDVNDLAALKMERPEVFDAAHSFILSLVADGKVTGLRIDHPDGLYDPKAYLERLQKAYVARANAKRDAPLYVVVEKILALGERLAGDWPVAGTSGYDFLDMVNGLFVQRSNEHAYTSLHEQWTGQRTRFADLAYEKKRLILTISLASELQMLASQLSGLAIRDQAGLDFTQSALRDALREVIACFPVYRSYVADGVVRAEDRAWIDQAVHKAAKRNKQMSPALFEYLKGVLLLQYPRESDDADRAKQRRFVGKFQQLTAPATAKGIEDTAFYIYNRLVSLNEVGGEPGTFGTSPDALHEYMRDRQANWPLALSPLSTHDTKRSEDVRARLNVLSEWPTEWHGCLERWGRLNARHRGQAETGPAPDRNDECLLYQTLIGAWPLDAGESAPATFVERIQAYMTKALREAKVHTTWTDPNSAYECAVGAFVAAVLDPGRSPEFLADFKPFQQRVSRLGMFNSLSQTLLRMAAPGVPDTYQGTELWDFSLVDPDNRRPVDYARRRQMLESFPRNAGGQDAGKLAEELLRSPEDGRVKLWLISRALEARRANPELFAAGEYVPERVSGQRSDHVFAFARRRGNDFAIVIAPRFFTELVDGASGLPLGHRAWGDTVVTFDGLSAARPMRDVFTGRTFARRDVGGGSSSRWNVADLLDTWPVAMLIGA